MKRPPPRKRSKKDRGVAPPPAGVDSQRLNPRTLHGNPYHKTRPVSPAPCHIRVPMHRFVQRTLRPDRPRFKNGCSGGFAWVGAAGIGGEDYPTTFGIVRETSFTRPA